jgi:hypothetical protein
MLLSSAVVLFTATAVVLFFAIHLSFLKAWSVQFEVHAFNGGYLCW